MNTNNNKNNDPKNFKIPPKEPQFAPKNNTTPLPQKHVKNNETEGKDELDGCDKFIMNRCNEPPPCLTKIPCCWKACENGYCCLPLGLCGLPFINDKPSYRKNIMYFAAFLSKIAIYLGIWACFATSENMGLVRIAPWSSGKVPLYQFLGGSNSTTYKIVQAKLGKNFDENAKVKMYIGLNGVVVDATDALKGQPGAETKFINWKEATCATTFSMKDSCEACKDVASSSSTMAIMGVITTIPQLTTDFLRAFPENDLRCQKAFGIITGLFGMITNLMALQLFNTVCHKDFDTEGDYFVAGSGLICITLASMFKAYDVIAHCIVPVPSNVKELAHRKLGMIKDAVHEQKQTIKNKINEMKNVGKARRA